MWTDWGLTCSTRSRPSQQTCFLPHYAFLDPLLPETFGAYGAFTLCDSMTWQLEPVCHVLNRTGVRDDIQLRPFKFVDVHVHFF